MLNGKPHLLCSVLKVSPFLELKAGLVNFYALVILFEEDFDSSDTVVEVKMSLLAKFCYGNQNMEKQKRERPTNTYIDQLRKDTAIEEYELNKSMSDRNQWRKLLMMF